MIRLACIIGIFLATYGTANAQSSLENPQPGSFQSGIGIISGWSCQGPSIGVAFDGGPRALVPYGSSRDDTRGACGANNTNTGFGLLLNFNLLGAGTHSAQLFVNGAPQGAPSQFTVTVPAGEFLTGASSQVSVTDFPSPGRVTDLMWQQSLQNFGVKSVRAKSQALHPAPPVATSVGSVSASLENPQSGSFQSGIGLISGWSCVGPAIGVAFDGGPQAVVPYGSTRADTAGVCGAGNTNTGFGLLLNFNVLGAGAHTVQLFVNGSPQGAPAQFTVTVPAGEFLTGVSSQVNVTDFPSPGKTTALVWQQSLQSFAVKSVGAGPAGFGVMESAFNFPGPYPTPAVVTYRDKTGKSISVGAFPGQVSIAVSRSAQVATISNLISRNGGTVIAQVPKLGLYWASVTPGTEASFISAMQADSTVIRVGPAVPAQLSQVLGAVTDLTSKEENKNTAPLVAAGDVAQFDFFGVEASQNCAAISHGQFVGSVMTSVGSGEPAVTVSQYNSFPCPDCAPIISSPQDLSFHLARLSQGTTGRVKVVNISEQGFAFQGIAADGTADRHDCTTAVCQGLLANEAAFLEQLYVTVENMDEAMRRNLVIVVAAGNGGLDLTGEMNFLRALTPNAASHILLVGGTKADGTPDPTFNSSQNPADVIFAQGDDVTATTNGITCTRRGTSFATPQVSRLAAQLAKTFPQLTGDQIIQVIFSAAGTGANGIRTLPTFAQARDAAQRLISPPQQKANLTPYLPQGWSDKIVVSNVPGTNTDSSPLLSTDTLYVDWAVLNEGPAATSTTFSTVLYVDGVATAVSTETTPLAANFYTYVQDFSLGKLGAGVHTLKIVADSTNTVDESNETDNEYTKTITVGSQKANLTPYQPPGWSDKIVVSKVPGTNTDSGGLLPTDSLYIDWAVLNAGSAATSSTFTTQLYVDGVPAAHWTNTQPLGANFYTALQDFSLGSLSAGVHTLKIVADSTNAIDESNEGDNEYTKTITVGNSSSSPATGIAFTSGVVQFGSAVNGRITPPGLFGISITCTYRGNRGSTDTVVTSTLNSLFTCSDIKVLSWPDSSWVITATVTGTNLSTSITY